MCKLGNARTIVQRLSATSVYLSSNQEKKTNKFKKKKNKDKKQKKKNKNKNTKEVEEKYIVCQAKVFHYCTNTEQRVEDESPLNFSRSLMC